MTLILILVIVAALAFDFINGFHDTANAIATVVSTRVLSPGWAILMAAGLNLAGALIATAVAKTIAGDIVDAHTATTTLTLSAVLGGIVWNLVTWFFGIPSSSSHALIGGLIGAAVAHGGVGSVKWQGLESKVLLWLVISPIIGFGIGYVVMTAINLFFANARPSKVGHVFRKLQIVSAAAMSTAHGSNDAQKSMGIITLALVAAHQIPKADVPLWVKLSCATVMALGTSVGGWRIIKTMGHKIIRLEPVNGFAAETAGAVTILVAGLKFGAPVSTTHVIAGSIFGVGASKRLRAVRWGVALEMMIAWVLTIPASAIVGALAYGLLKLIGL